MSTDDLWRDIMIIGQSRRNRHKREYNTYEKEDNYDKPKGKQLEKEQEMITRISNCMLSWKTLEKLLHV